MSSTNSNKSQIELTAKITGPDGKITQKTIVMEEEIPTPDEMDFSTKEGFLRDFGKVEQAFLEARNKIGEEMTQEYLNSKSGKKTNHRRPEK